MVACFTKPHIIMILTVSYFHARSVASSCGRFAEGGVNSLSFSAQRACRRRTMTRGMPQGL